MSDVNVNNSKRIAKNSAFMYMRMILVMCVSFFTSRVILQSLGVVDFGIYNVVAGISFSFVFFSVTLSASTQRFLNYELGKNNTVRLNQIFNLSLICFVGIGLLVMIVGLSVGSWVISEKLQIPIERHGDALIVFYCALISLLTIFVFSVYESALIAHENMKIYAWLGVFDALMKLSIAFLVYVFPHKLVVYAIMMALAQVLSKLILLIYCRRKYTECKLRFYWNWKMFREIFVFSGWNVVNGGIWMVNEQGSNVLLNLFFGPIANAAYGIVMQVYYTVSSISSNFFVAFKPQIVKSYAAGDFDYVRSLAFSSSRYTLYITWLIVLPIMLRSQDILSIWLVEYPHYAIPMIRTALIFLLTVVLSNPANMVAMATGHLKKMTIFSSGVYLLAFPVIWLSLKLGQQPYFVFIVLAVHRFLWTIITYIVIRRDIIISLSEFFKKVIFPSVCVIILSCGVSYILDQALIHGLIGLICFAMLSVLSTAAIVFVIGMQRDERVILKNYLHRIISKKKSDVADTSTNHE